MPYCLPDDVRGVLSESDDPSSDLGSAASMTDEQLEAAIADAQMEIDARLAGRYPTPFGDPNDSVRIPVPPLVRRICRDIAGFLATLTFKKGAELVPGHPVLLRNASAQSLLAAIANGTIDLDLPAGWEADQPAEAASGGVTVVNQVPGLMFAPVDFDIGPALPGRRRRVGGPFESPY